MSDGKLDSLCLTCVRSRQGYCDGAEKDELNRPCEFYKRMTNGDRIRAMTDEKLAQWLTFVEGKILAKQPALSRSELFADWLDWLKQEVSDNG